VGSVFSATVPRLPATGGGAPSDGRLTPLPHTF
jgi:hypothetical protein